MIENVTKPLVGKHAFNWVICKAILIIELIILIILLVIILKKQRLKVQEVLLKENDWYFRYFFIH